MATINGTNGDDTQTGTSSADTINGDSGSDTITGDAGADIINAGEGNDTVSGGAGQDTINLGVGDDTWIVKDDEVVLNAAYGSWGASAIFDTVDGGDGTDTIWIQNSRNVNIDLSKSTISGFEALQIVPSSGSNYESVIRLNEDQINQLDSIEARYGHQYASFQVIGTNNIFNNMGINGHSSGVNHVPVIYVTDDGDGVITIDASSINVFNAERLVFESQAVFTNNDGNLHLSGSNLDDTLTGGAGIDVFGGEAGNDVLSGNAGSDVLQGGDGNDTISGGSGNDWLKGEAGNDTLQGGDGDDQLIGGRGTNILRGEAGNDTLTTGESDEGAVDEVYGGSGNDTIIIYENGTGVIDGGTGTDRILVTATSDISGYSISNVEKIELDAVAKLYLTPEQAAAIPISINETVVSSEVWLKLPKAGSFTLTEPYYALSNKVAGSDGIDIITGSGGNDSLAGAGGSDTIRALAGNDTIVLSNADWDQTNRWQYSNNDEFDNGIHGARRNKLDNIDGGDGIDTLEFQYKNETNAIDTLFLDNSIKNIERFVITGNTDDYGSLRSVIFEAELFRHLDFVSLHTPMDSNSKYYPNTYIIGDGGAISLSNLDSSTNLNELTINGRASEFSISNFGGSFGSINVGKFGAVKSIIGSINDDTFFYNSTNFLDNYGGAKLDLNLGDGDDTVSLNSFYLPRKSLSLTGEWVGGSGDDTFHIGNLYGGVLDLTSVNISGFENLTTGNSDTTLFVTESQANSINITGSGSYLVKLSDGTVQGTSGADSLWGKGVESFRGSEGNDTADFIDTAVFSDIRNNYTITRDPNNPENVTVEHSGGTLDDGTDTIKNALWLSFADDPASGPTYSLDDHHQNKRKY
jgi:Ca2+-binding RTX toxin-like protein